MVLLSDIFDDIESGDIALFHYDAGPHKSATIEMNGSYGVFVNTLCFEHMRELKLALIHEIGHCATGSTHRLGSPFNLVEQHEARANRYAALRYVPPGEFERAFGLGLTRPFELAEWFDLPQPFVEATMRYYFDNGLLKNRA